MPKQQSSGVSCWLRRPPFNWRMLRSGPRVGKHLSHCRVCVCVCRGRHGEPHAHEVCPPRHLGRISMAVTTTLGEMSLCSVDCVFLQHSGTHHTSLKPICGHISFSRHILFPPTVHSSHIGLVWRPDIHKIPHYVTLGCLISPNLGWNFRECHILYLHCTPRLRISKGTII